jgi:hypothetical protein
VAITRRMVSDPEGLTPCEASTFAELLAIVCVFRTLTRPVRQQC